jgi:hypothetical protein
MALDSAYYLTESPFLLSTQIGWEPQIANSDLPLWMRVFAVAMARSEPNLHAPFESGELAELLGKRLPDGSTKPVERRDLHKCVKRAVALDLLDETSSVRCLVLPASRTACRRSGYKKPCAYHTGQASKIKKPIAIKRTITDPLKRDNRNAALPQVTGPAVGNVARQCRVEQTPTPGSRDIFAVKPRPVEAVSA